MLKMMWSICAVFCAVLVTGKLGAASAEEESGFAAGSHIKELLSVGEGQIHQGLQVGSISISDTKDKSRNYHEERGSQTERGAESQAVVSPSGASYSEHAHEAVNAHDHHKLSEDERRKQQVTAGSVSYRREQERQLEEEERRKLASRRDHRLGLHASASGAGAVHHDTEAVSAEEDRRRREKARDRTKWAAGSSVSITHDKQGLSDEEIRRRRITAKQHTDALHTGSGAVHSESNRLSQEELHRKLKALNETKDLQAGESRLIHKKYKGSKHEHDQDLRKSDESQQVAGYSGYGDHSKSAHSEKDRRENSRGHQETIELSAGKHVGLQERLGHGHTDQYGRQVAKVRESTAVAGVGTGRLEVQRNAESGSQEIRRGDQRYHDVGVHLRKTP